MGKGVEPQLYPLMSPMASMDMGAGPENTEGKNPGAPVKWERKYVHISEGQTSGSLKADAGNSW